MKKPTSKKVHELKAKITLFDSHSSLCEYLIESGHSYHWLKKAASIAFKAQSDATAELDKIQFGKGC